MATASDLLRCAAAEIGYCRYDDPQAGTKYGRWYASLVGNSYYGESGVPYCAMFVSWCLDQCGITATGFPSAYTPDLTNAARRAGVDKRAANLTKGDIVLFDWGRGGYSVSADATDHVGLVVENTGSFLYTIEGNTTGSDGRSGSVAYRSREYADVVCGYAPKYIDEVKEWSDMATYEEVKAAAKEAAIEALNERVPELVLNATYEGHATKDMWQLASYDTSDPTGRGKNCTTHDHVKWVAAELTDTTDPTGRGMEMSMREHIKWIAAVEQEIKEIVSNIASMLGDLSDSDDVSDKVAELKDLAAKYNC